MNRRSFLQLLTMIPLSTSSMNIKEFGKIMSDSPLSDKMPALFIGHGSPMNAIVDNPFSKSWQEIGSKLAPPTAILCISAHWLTKGTSVTMSPTPKTIHDFGGFPQDLFDVQYPAKGAVETAKMTINEVKSVKIHEDFGWGLDHGTWSVLKNMYPKADIPVFQLSIDYGKPLSYHFDLAKELAFLRTKGVLVIGSGNVVHNLRRLKYDEPNPKPFDWAIEFDNHVKKCIEDNSPTPLIDYQSFGSISDMAHPTNDHYIPLIYTLGLRNTQDDFSFFNNTIDMGSISMRSVMFG